MTDVAERPVAEAPAAAQVADSLADLMRSFVRTRQAMMQASEHDVDWTSHIVLRCLKANGPMRAGAIAECTQADPSTISRQVAAMVKDGLVERQADPADGRASILVLTDRAEQVLADFDELRNDYFSEMLQDWDLAELEQFAVLLDRFTTSYKSTDHDVLISRIAKVAHAHRSSRSTS